MGVVAVGDVLRLHPHHAQGPNATNGSMSLGRCEVTVTGVDFVGGGGGVGIATLRVKPNHGCNATSGVHAAAAYANDNGLTVDPSALYSVTANGSITAWTSELLSGVVPDNFGTLDLSAHTSAVRRGRTSLSGTLVGSI
jgi:hypothetical protein